MGQYPRVIGVEGVSKQFVLHKDKSFKERVLQAGHSDRDAFWALRDIDLSIPMNSTVGLMGHNGSGKSTLLKIIGSIIQPTKGSVVHRGRIAALLELGAGFHPDLTGRENVYLNAAILGMTEKETDRAFDDIVEFSGISKFIDTQVKFYSSGMYVRLAFAVAIHVDPDVLLVDEVLAVGDEPFQRKCMDKIREFQAEGRTIVLVSHSADQVGSVADRAVVLDHGQMVFDGATQDAIHILRAGFQEEERSEAAKDGSGAQRSGAARILATRLLDASGREIDSAVTGEDVVVAVDVTSSEGLDSWMAAMTIETSLGQMLFRYDSKAAGMALPGLRGDATVEFRIPQLALGDGAFPVNVGVGDASGSTIDRVAGAVILNVKGPSVGTGPVGLRPEIRFRQR